MAALGKHAQRVQCAKSRRSSDLQEFRIDVIFFAYNEMLRGIKPLFQRKENIMQLLMHVKLPHQQFNSAVADGTAGQKINRILDEIKPEAVYFTEHDGKRGAIMIVNLDDSAKIPSLSEP
jgi:hypothetical protein